jgi:hypothetical protein
MNNGIPTRKKENIFSEILLKHASNKNNYYILTEDENIPKLYKTIFNRVAPDKIISKVYGLGGKKTVLNYFEDWKKKHNQVNNCFFIVDKDFDYWTGKNKVEQHHHLLELPCYTFENLLYTPETATIIIETYKNNSKIQLNNDYLSTNYWENWENSFAESLSNLFIYFVIAIKNNVDIPNCGANPHQYIEYNHNNGVVSVKTATVENYKKQLIKEIGEETFLTEVEFIKSHYDINGTLDYSKLIKGKYLLFGLLSQVRIVLNNRNIFHNEIDPGLANSILHEIPLKYIDCFSKIKNI